MGSTWLLASPAGASLDGPCEGQGTFRSDGEVVNANTADVITVPDEDTVDYIGRINTDEIDRSHNGAIELDLPFPLPNVAIVDWGTDSTDDNEDSDSYDYELPWYVPRGVEIPVEGFHHDTGGKCDGEVTIEIDGGPFDSPAAAGGAVLGTLLTGFGLVAAARAR